MSRLERVVGRLKRRYGRLPAPPSDPFTLFVWGIVSNHSTPRKRDATLTALRRHQALTPDGMWKASQKHLEESVALAGPYPSQRILGLRKGVEIFRRHPDFLAAIRGPVPAALKALKGMPQMGESGSYRMLLFAGNHPVLPVDARVGRVATRLGYGEKSANFPKSARSIRQAVASELPASVDAYRAAYLYLEHHGAATCTETSPRCDECPLLNDCSHGQRELSAPKAR